MIAVDLMLTMWTSAFAQNTSQSARHTLWFLLSGCLCIFFVFEANAAENSCAWESRKYDLIPVQAAAAKDFNELNQSNFVLFPQFEESDFEQIIEVPNDGKLNLGTHTAQLKGHEVFIKSVHPHVGAAEALWMLFHNRIGLGPQFLGVVLDIVPEYDPIRGVPANFLVNGHLGLVMERLEGLNFKSYIRPEEIPTDFVLTQAMIDEMVRQLLVSHDAGVLNDDPQFMISDNKIVMIDFEKVKLLKLSSEDSIEDALFVFRQRVKRWKVLGRLEQGAIVDPSRVAR